MTQADEEPGEKSIDSLAVEDAVAVIQNRTENEPDDLKRALSYVTEDGVVSWEAADEAVALAAKVVSTPETRVELAEIALEDATEAAPPVSDYQTVHARLDEFDARLTAIEDDVETLGADLQAVVAACEQRTDLFAVARGLRDLTAAANRAHAAADELALDIEAFERWVGSHDVRVNEFTADVDAVEASIESVSSTVEEVADAVEGDAGARSNFDDEAVETTWVTATFERQTLALVLADVRAELGDLQRLAATDGVEKTPQLDTARTRLDRLDEQLATAGNRLDGLALPAWRDRYGEPLEALEAELATFDPPIEWGAVDATLRDIRTRVGLQD